MDELSPIPVGPDDPKCEHTEGICNYIKRCEISRELLNQTHSGGRLSPSTGQGNGPYWSEDGWNSYVGSISAACVFCIKSRAVHGLLTKVEEAKRRGDEIYQDLKK